MFNNIPNHIDQALARLLTQYSNSPNLQNLLTGIITPIQAIEDELGLMNTLRYLPLATGAQLDIIGAIVGIARAPGQSDASYLISIYGQIKINTSEGLPEQMIQAYQLFTGAMLVLLYEGGFAGMELESSIYFSSQAQVNMVISRLLEAAPAGVRVDELVSFDPVAPFSMDGTLSPGAGFGDLFDAGAGGGFATGSFFTEYFGMDGDDPTIAGFGDNRDPLVGGVFASL